MGNPQIFEYLGVNETNPRFWGVTKLRERKRVLVLGGGFFSFSLFLFLSEGREPTYFSHGADGNGNCNFLGRNAKGMATIVFNVHRKIL